MGKKLRKKKKECVLVLVKGKDKKRQEKTRREGLLVVFNVLKSMELFKRGEQIGEGGREEGRRRR